MRPIIEARGISKQYRIGERHRYGSLRESLSQWARAPLQSARRERSAKPTIWALKDASFDVNPGEVLGIIGRNGAGKSTLLKVLSRITEPTEGEVRIFGRVASLLEVGTGFHPELTGRENVYLNGAVMGMSRAEIVRKFDAIVAFAEVEKFIDTAVKHYSSGMYVRLAFAVAAHLEPEILIIDEVLAVGDARFQEKCLGKMEDAAKSGRTVLFVSHNMGAVRTLCTRAILLDEGQIVGTGSTAAIVRQYLTGNTDAVVHTRELRSLARTKGSGDVRIVFASIQSNSGEPRAEFAIWEPFTLTITAESRDDVAVATSFWVLIYSAQGHVVLSAFQYDVLEHLRVDSEGVTVQVEFDPVGLVPGRYSVSVGAFGRHNEFFDWVDGALGFEIKSEFHTGRPFDHRLGEFSLPYEWAASKSAKATES